MVLRLNNSVLSATSAIPASGARWRCEGAVMIVSAIAAIDRSGLIGNGMQMPWHLPRDLKRFRQHTLGKPVIMGRRTLESLGAPLGGRLNIVLTHNDLLQSEGIKIAYSIVEALKL